MSPPLSTPRLAVALSGGGFRASLAALGVLRFLADVELLGAVRFSSSVSGGSVANGVLAHSYETLQREAFSRASFDAMVVRPFVDRITHASLKSKLVRNVWRIVGPGTRTDLLARSFDDWFYDGRRLEDLTDQCRFTFNAANLSTGVRFGFERDRVGDWVSGYVVTPARLRLSQAVAASAAVPGAFAPMKLRGVSLPCAAGRPPRLVDGGAYDNMALGPVDDFADGTFLVALNAGGLFRTGRFGQFPIVRDLQRANSLLYRQTTALRLSAMVDRFRAWEQADDKEHVPSWARRGVLFSLATTMDPLPEWASSRPELPPWLNAGSGIDAWREAVALTETSFNKFPEDRCQELLYRGWWLAGAALTKYHRQLLPARLPSWSPIGAEGP